MKTLPLIILFFVLLTPCLVSASEIGNVTPSFVNPTFNTTSGNESKTIEANESVTTAVSTNQESHMNAGEAMIQNAIFSVILRIADGVVSGLSKGGTLGDLGNSTDYNDEQRTIFAVATHTIRPFEDESLVKAMDEMKQVFIYGSVIFGLLSTLFLILQQLSPKTSSKIVGMVDENQGYLGVNDIAEYYITICAWLLAAPGILYAVLWINEFLVTGLMVSVLDQITLSYDNVGLYVLMVFLYCILAVFFSYRLVVIIIAVRLWWIFGLVFAIKKVRWVAAMIVPHIVVIILAQFAIVWSTVTIVQYTHSSDVGWISTTLLYLGMFLFDCMLAVLAILWSIIWRILSPKTLKFIIRAARYI